MVKVVLRYLYKRWKQTSQYVSRTRSLCAARLGLQSLLPSRPAVSILKRIAFMNAMYDGENKYVRCDDNTLACASMVIMNANVRW